MSDNYSKIFLNDFVPITLLMEMFFGELSDGLAGKCKMRMNCVFVLFFSHLWLVNEALVLSTVCYKLNYQHTVCQMFKFIV